MQYLGTAEHVALVQESPPGIQRLCWPSLAAGEIFESSFVDAILVHTFLKPGTIGVLWQFFSQRFVQVKVSPELLEGITLTKEEESDPAPEGGIVLFGPLARHCLLRFHATVVAVYRADNHYTDSDKAYVVVNPSHSAWVYEGGEVMPTPTLAQTTTMTQSLIPLHGR